MDIGDFPPGVTNADISRHDNQLDDDQALCTRCESAYPKIEIYHCPNCERKDMCERCIECHTCLDGVAGGKSVKFAALVAGVCILGVALVGLAECVAKVVTNE